MPRNGREKRSDHVVVALNLSQEGQRTLKWAFEKCNSNDKITILHVVEVLPGKAGPRCVTSVPSDELAIYKGQIEKACLSMLFIYEEFYVSNNITVSVKVLHGVNHRQVIIENVMLLGGTKLVFDDIHWSKRSALKFYVDHLHPKCFIYLIRGGSLVSMKVGKAVKSTCSPRPSLQNPKSSSNDKNPSILLKNSPLTKLFLPSPSPSNSPSPSSSPFRFTPPHRYLGRAQISPGPRSPRDDDSLCDMFQSPRGKQFHNGQSRNIEISVARSSFIHSPLSQSIREEHPMTGDEGRDASYRVESGRFYDPSETESCYRCDLYEPSDSGSDRKMNRSDSFSSSIDSTVLNSPISVLEKLKSIQDSYPPYSGPFTSQESFSAQDSPASSNQEADILSSPNSMHSRIFHRAVTMKNAIKKLERSSAKVLRSMRNRPLSHSGPLPRIEPSSFTVEEIRRFEIENLKRPDDEEAEGDEEKEFYLEHARYLHTSNKDLSKAFWLEKEWPDLDPADRKEERARSMEKASESEPDETLNKKFDFGISFFPDNYFKMYLKSDLEEATNYFSSGNLIGNGGFSSVYRGILKDGKKIAVKRLKECGANSQKEFETEVGMLNNLKHRFVVSLLGFCMDKDEKWLVYDLMENGNLEDLLQSNENVLNWNLRYKISIECARGLEYLHSFCPWPIIHRDIKTANILLDDNMTVKVSDFGLAKWNLKNRTLTGVEVVGTFGYLAPEYFMYGKLSDKTDVFSFGIVLLELLTGNKPIDPSRPKGKENLLVSSKADLEACNVSSLIDPKLKGRYDEAQVKRMMRAACACLRHNPNLRPKMHEVVRFLEESSDSNSLGIFSSEYNMRDRLEATEDFTAGGNETGVGNNIEKEIMRQKLIALALGE